MMTGRSAVCLEQQGTLEGRAAPLGLELLLGCKIKNTNTRPPLHLRKHLKAQIWQRSASCPQGINLANLQK